MLKNKIVIANWKMNPISAKEAEKLLSETKKLISQIKKTKIVICPPYVYFDKLKKVYPMYSRGGKISLGAQNSFLGDQGAFTGEVSPEMLYDLGVRYVILGHSERRNLQNGLGEDNQFVNRKVKAALAAGLIPVVCVGEKERDHNHEYLNFIKLQIEECLNGVSKNSISKIIVAYEPIWAIGAGALSATGDEFQEMYIFIRKILSDKFGVKNIEDFKILYGGSVDEKNTTEFIFKGGADGFLVGRASLEPKKFFNIVKICEALSK